MFFPIFYLPYINNIFPVIYLSTIPILSAEVCDRIRVERLTEVVVGSQYNDSHLGIFQIKTTVYIVFSKKDGLRLIGCKKVYTLTLKEKACMSIQITHQIILQFDGQFILHY